MINEKQKKIVYFGAVLIILQLMFPPFVIRGYNFFTETGRIEINRLFVGILLTVAMTAFIAFLMEEPWVKAFLTQLKNVLEGIIDLLVCTIRYLINIPISIAKTMLKILGYFVPEGGAKENPYYYHILVLIMIGIVLNYIILVIQGKYAPIGAFMLGFLVCIGIYFAMWITSQQMQKKRKEWGLKWPRIKMLIKRIINNIYIPQLIVITFLIRGMTKDLVPEQYAVIHIICFWAFLYLSIRAYTQKKSILFPILLITSIPYGLFFRHQLPIGAWEIIDLFAIGIALKSFFALNKSRQEIVKLSRTSKIVIAIFLWFSFVLPPAVLVFGNEEKEAGPRLFSIFLTWWLIGQFMKRVESMFLSDTKAEIEEDEESRSQE